MQAPRAMDHAVPPVVISMQLPVPAKVTPAAKASPLTVRTQAISPAAQLPPSHVPVVVNQVLFSPTNPGTQVTTTAVVQSVAAVNTVAAVANTGSAPAGAASPSVPPSFTTPSAVEQPSSHADYLHNPIPAYPPISKRLGEQGTVVVRVFIEVDGTAKTTELAQSSGFDRLDRAAMSAALGWRYVPGKKAGVAQAMWVNVPIPFILK